MGTTSSMGLRLPTQGAVDRSTVSLPAPGATASAMGVEASQWQALIPIATDLAKQYGPGLAKDAWNTISSWF